MSAAASPSLKNVTKGWTPIPVSLIENQAALAPGELRLALVVLRRGDDRPISDTHWTKWTGLSPRLKEYAIKGLREKGLVVEGRGDEAKFSWDGHAWSRYVHTLPPVGEPTKARTAGRSVDPKPGAKVHAECRDKGCAMLRAECASGGLSLITPTGIAKPVAQSSTVGTPSPLVTSSAASSSTATSTTQLTSISSTPIAQPVAQSAYWNLSAVWAQTLAALQAVFPLIDVSFLVRLLSIVQVLFKDVTDSELAKAVNRAYSETGSRMKSEGLFLKTVPEALAASRRVPKPIHSPPDCDEHLDDSALEEVRAVAENPDAPDWQREKARRILRKRVKPC